MPHSRSSSTEPDAVGLGSADTTRSEDAEPDPRQGGSLGILWLNPALRFMPVPAGTSVIGRGPNADLKLDDAKVSRAHVRIETSDAEFLVTDLKGTHGLFVNEMRTASAILREQDVMRIGGSVGVVTRSVGPWAAGATGLSREIRGLVLGAKTSAVFARAGQVAKSRAPLGIAGDAGTGKSELATLIHQWSGRAQFVVVDCARATKHAIELGPPGATLYLKHVHQLSKASENAWAQALEVQHGCRVIYSSSVPLVETQLSPELVSRLAPAVEFRLPPLAERKEEAVAVFLLALREAAGYAPSFQARALERIANYHWRSFPEVMQAAHGTARLNSAAAGDPAARLALADLPEQLLQDQSKPKVAAEGPEPLLKSALIQADFNITGTARLLGITRQSVHRMIARSPELTAWIESHRKSTR